MGRGKERGREGRKGERTGWDVGMGEIEILGRERIREREGMRERMRLGVEAEGHGRGEREGGQDILVLTCFVLNLFLFR